MHINGAVALLRTALPIKHLPDGGARVVLQVLFSLVSYFLGKIVNDRFLTFQKFIPSQMTDTPLAPVFFDCLGACEDGLKGSPEKVCVDLAMTMANLVQFSSVLVRQNVSDESPEMDSNVEQLLALRAACDRLEQRLWETYPYGEKHDSSLPAVAVFHGIYHTYTEIWSARIWNHFRWARILILEILLRISAEYPVTGAKYVSAQDRMAILGVVRRMALDILISTPSHWHHPILDKPTAKMIEAPSKGGTGAVGLPTTLWHLKVAACAPGVEAEIYNWVYNVMQVVWKDMGMQHARLISGFMEEHRIGLEKEDLNRKLKLEDDDEY